MNGSSRAVSPAQIWPVVTIGIAVAVLYFAREVFMPLAIALLLTFALAPVVTFVRRTGLPRIVAVILVVTATFIGLAAFSFVVATQVADLARNVPTYQTNILTKIQNLKKAGTEDGVIKRVSDAIQRVGKEIEQPKEAPAETIARPEPDPILVEIYSPTRPIQILTNMIAPLVSPLATVGLVLVVVIFMLLEREDLRDRFVRLVGYDDIHRTTEALQEAGQRVGRYLLTQLIVNVAYGVPIGIGLWLIGIPNAVLWGLLAIVLRFVPYIGPVIAMVLPLFLAVAVAPGWSLVLWAAALFIVMELISNNIVEPWLYGSKTGLSPLAIIVAAIFWTWIWGPVGLVLSTPLTVCLVVLGRHVPQFQFFEVLFGSEPVLDPEARLYQRLLAGDADEATDQSEEFLEEKHLADFYEQIAIPAMLLAEQDRARGVMTEEQKQRLAASAQTLVSNLKEIALEEEEEEAEDRENGELPEDGAARAKKAKSEMQGETGVDEKATAEIDLPDGTGRSVLVVGGRGPLDDATASMLAQVLRVTGATAAESGYADLEPARLRQLKIDGVETIVICFLNPDSLHHGRFLVRRLKRMRARLRIGVVLWSQPRDMNEKPKAAAKLGADFVAFSVAEAVTNALNELTPQVDSAAAPDLAAAAQ
jgi:predicted PurR-regulated permease PerM